MSVYDYKLNDNKGNEVSLSDYKGKVLLIVNTATDWGFTKQYSGLEYLYNKYKDRGFEIIDIPCNQFGEQAQGTGEEIESFCKTNYNVSFKQFEKSLVNGEGELPLYTYLKSQKKGIMGTNIKWNFTKFLIDTEGKVIDRFPPMLKPEKIEPKIEALLK